MNSYDPYSFDFDQPELPASVNGPRDIAIAIMESGDLIAQPRSPRAVAWFAAFSELEEQPGLYRFPVARMSAIGTLLDRTGFTRAPLIVTRLFPLEVSTLPDAEIAEDTEPSRTPLHLAWQFLVGTARRSIRRWRPLQGSNLQPAD